eukprot:gnl/Trimastix_PCT/340.p1 GENE.gnl/Trimastix_PCT/340~~gnl/Trimastix_PCT/340.p1  ORF type:complete len:487 (-),score=170.93 gnl/Trimastix_PCT/340:103-1563(-)
MRALLLLLGLVCLAFCQSPPVWPEKYYLEAVMTLPYGNVSEPMNVDYVKDQWIFINRHHGLNTKLHRDGRTYNVYVRKDHYACRILGASMPQLLPDLSDWKYFGIEDVRGIPCYHYNKEVHQGQKTNHNQFFVNVETGAPVQYVMRGYDVVFGSHYDLYVLDFYKYIPDFVHANHSTPSELCDVNDFDNFATQYNKEYSSEEERLRRKAIFEDNLEFIRQHNEQNSQMTLAVNHFADMTFDEFKSIYANARVSDEYKAPIIHHASGRSLPEHIDWRLRNAVTDVKDQCICGSCWTFGTMGTTEGAFAIKTGELRRFSEQSIVDCFWNSGNNGCQGGEHQDALNYLMHQTGIKKEESYPYMMVEGFCKADAPEYPFTISSWADVEHGSEEALKDALATRGPVAVAIAVTRKMVFYGHGIFVDEECGSRPQDLGHSVTAVGYGVENGQEYWILKNSWAPYWGNNGYIYVARNHHNMCGCATSAAYAIA